jgi:TRAP-type C4-dicarboxylate transport system substrate-binding protein
MGPDFPLLAWAARTLAALCVAFVCWADACAGGTPATELKLSVATSPALPLGRAAQRWAERVNEGTQGALAVRLHPGAVLAYRDPAREFAALRDGPADLAVGSALQWSQQVPALGVFGLPWIAPSDGDLERAARSAALRKALAQALDRAGATLVAIAPLGHRDIVTVTRTIREPADLRGLSVRTAPLPMVQELFVALGALPQSTPLADAQGEFASGALAGQEGPSTSLAAARIHAFGPTHLTLWGAVGDAMVFAMRKPLWESLSEEQRQRFRAAAEGAIVDTDALGREAAAREHLAQNGVARVRLTTAGHDAFRAAVAPMYARWRTVVGNDLAALAEEARKASAESTSVPTAAAPAPGKRP